MIDKAIKKIKSNEFNGGNTVKRLGIINKSGLAKVQPYIVEGERGYYLEATIGNSDYRVKVTEEKKPFVRYFKKVADAEKAMNSIIWGNI